MDAKSTGNGYAKVIAYSFIVVAAWGLVPGLAKLGSLSTGLTTMFVNWFAVIGLGLFLVLTGKVREFRRPQPYGKLVLLGLVWPLAYSIAFFGTVDLGSASLATITNYCWPAVFLVLGFFTGRKFSLRSWLVVVMAILAVVIPVVLEGSFSLMVIPVALGLTAALTQALYSLWTENVTQDPLIVTFIVEMVTAVGATAYVLAFEKLSLPSITTIGCLAIIGLVSNGVGFWAFLRAGQVSKSEHAKTLFLMLMCLTPIVQVVVLPLLSVEVLTVSRWSGVVLIALALLFYRLPWPSKYSV